MDHNEASITRKITGIGWLKPMPVISAIGIQCSVRTCIECRALGSQVKLTFTEADRDHCGVDGEEK